VCRKEGHLRSLPMANRTRLRQGHRKRVFSNRGGHHAWNCRQGNAAPVPRKLDPAGRIIGSSTQLVSGRGTVGGLRRDRNEYPERPSPRGTQTIHLRRCCLRSTMPRCYQVQFSTSLRGQTMRICHLLQQKRPVFSFEFFPPKTPQGEAALFRTIEALRPLAPGFVSVTYGAGGSTREKTLDWVARIKHELGIEAMAHLTCVGSNRDEMRAMLQRIDDLGIENVLALRGDPPRDQPGFQPVPDGFAHASDLVRFIRTEGFSFCLGGAAYPEGHIEAPDLETDLTYLGEKVAAGVDFLITQLFFDNRFFFDFVERARSRGIHVPIIPGIMPITNVAQIERFTRLCGASIPPALQARLDAVRHNEDAVRSIGIEHAAAQCRDLLAHGVPGIHFYTLNQSPATRAIVEQLQRGPVACPAS